MEKYTFNCAKEPLPLSNTLSAAKLVSQCKHAVRFFKKSYLCINFFQYFIDTPGATDSALSH